MENSDDVPLSDEEPVTAQIVLRTLQEVWLNEKFSPELLQHQSDLVDCMLDQIQQMEENLCKLKKNDFRVVIHRMELDRIRYMVTDYLRIRLNKIEQYVIHILEQETSRSPEDAFLSPPEHKFAREYLAHMEDHFRLIALRHMPSNVQDFDKTKMAVAPNISSHIFLRVKKNITGVVIEGDSENRDEEVDLDENSQHIMQYKPIADYLKSGAVQLV
ncbi:DNA replication complex GINS protein SLD5 [Zootermopsis nevadensis]|uniref:DNA replication complex GINS protein SLD5 n=1 Tax=Zootermopsis nevadensis TaxID=136037 RepID=A0A067QQL3_ZOONE|nr:DNA replication complex GINS protein SLD5 [Zootermopsis nevadensis]XP_021934293.1 DNA replication complex GINS protein SLD5 [Zootermopsis nevadensis]XP_021934294.1 DNA replication complex GINS protein SLD5 [Zootermopsis nevadensis]KDR11621.1 DNA replication complex GINS protein SLD5 [Zootermopsis nevadensis]